MPLIDELERLQSLRAQGALTEDEFSLAKKRLLDGEPAVATGRQTVREPSRLHSLMRSTSDRWIGGVCGGLAEFSNLPTWSWRLLFVLLLLLHGLGLLVYLLMWIFVPLAKAQLPAPAAATSNNGGANGGGSGGGSGDGKP